jgi:hypothetical protein
MKHFLRVGCVRNRLLVSYFAFLSFGCSRQQGQTCAQAVAVEKSFNKTRLDMMTQFELPKHLPGGVLEFEYLKDFPQSSSTEKRFCAFLATQSSKNNKTKFWTADHCYWPAFAKKITAHFYDGEGGYSSILLNVEIAESAHKSLNELNQLGTSSFGMLSRALNLKGNRPLSLARESSKKCHQYDTSSLNGKSVGEVCFSLLDMATFEASMDKSNIYPENHRIWDAIEEKFSKISTSSSQAEAESLVDEIVLARVNSALLDVKTLFSSCKDPAQSSEALCRDKSKVDDKIVEIARQWSISELTAESLEMRWARIDRKADDFWSQLGSSEKGFTLHMNFASNEAGNEYKSFSWLPLAAMGKVTRGGVNGGLAEKYVFHKISNTKSLKFFSGDSGSILLYGGTPIAALSTKDGEGTSGGATFVQLPPSSGVSRGRTPKAVVASPSEPVSRERSASQTHVPANANERASNEKAAEESGYDGSQSTSNPPSEQSSQESNQGNRPQASSHSEDGVMVASGSSGCR